MKKPAVTLLRLKFGIILRAVASVAIWHHERGKCVEMAGVNKCHYIVDDTKPAEKPCRPGI